MEERRNPPIDKIGIIDTIGFERKTESGKPRLIVVGEPGPEHMAHLAKLHEENEVIIVPNLASVSGELSNPFSSAPPKEKIMKISDFALQELEDLKYGGLSKKQRNANIIPVRTGPKYQRNQPCPCGSGKKYKNCCGKS